MNLAHIVMDAITARIPSQTLIGPPQWAPGKYVNITIPYGVGKHSVAYLVLKATSSTSGSLEYYRGGAIGETYEERWSTGPDLATTIDTGHASDIAAFMDRVTADLVTTYDAIVGSQPDPKPVMMDFAHASMLAFLVEKALEFSAFSTEEQQHLVRAYAVLTETGYDAPNVTAALHLIEGSLEPVEERPIAMGGPPVSGPKRS